MRIDPTKGRSRTGAVPRRRRRVGAILSVELMLVLPILLIGFLALLEISLLLVGEAKLAAASREGARVAAMGGNDGDVLGAVSNVLGPNLSTQVDLTKLVTYPLSTWNTGDPVQVAVCVQGNALAPNFLAGLGFDLSKKTICSQTTMTIE